MLSMIGATSAGEVLRPCESRARPEAGERGAPGCTGAQLGVLAGAGAPAYCACARAGSFQLV